MVTFPPVPREVKPLAHLLKLAETHDESNIVVAYWARMSASQFAVRLVPGKKSAETEELIRQLLDWLEETKKANEDNEAITSPTTAQTLIKDYALQLFAQGEQYDSAQVFNKNTVKTFYAVGMLMDVLEQFGSLSDDLKLKRKYAKWKAVYIHNCLKAGELPLPGPPRGVNDFDSGIVHNSTIPKEEFATYTRYTGIIPLDNGAMEKMPADKPVSSDSTPEEHSDVNIPEPDNDNKFVRAPVYYPTNPVVSLFLSPQPPTAASLPAASGRGKIFIAADEMQKAQMYCEFATAALKYGDVKSAADNLHKVLNLLQIGNLLNRKI